MILIPHWISCLASLTALHRNHRMGTANPIPGLTKALVRIQEAFIDVRTDYIGVDIKSP